MSFDRRCRGVPASRRVIALAAVIALVVIMLGALSAWRPAVSAHAAPAPSASDPRADFQSGNVDTCADAGFASDEQLGSDGDLSDADPNVSGTVAGNQGAVQPGRGEELNVAINPDAPVVIDAVIVEGSNNKGYNEYTDDSVLPPALPPDQHYIAPFNGGGMVVNINHWFVCYSFTTPLPAGSLEVFKILINPAGIPVTPLPTSYTAEVNCDDGDPAHSGVTVTLPNGGGEGTPTLEGLADGTTCTVAEDTTSLPPEAVVRYAPAGAQTASVTISDDTATEVHITNDLSAVPVQLGAVQVVADVNNPTGAPVPPTLTAHVSCSDDRTDTQVTMPGAGGPGLPTLQPVVGSLCEVDDFTVPSGWTVTYSVDGGLPTTDPPLIAIASPTQTVTLTIAAEPPAVTTTTEPTTTTTEPTTTTSSSTTTTTIQPTTTTTTTGSTTTTTGSTTTTTAAPTTTTSSSTTTTGAPTTTTSSSTTTTTTQPTTTTTGSTTTTTGSTTTTTGSTTTTTGSTTTTTVAPTTTTSSTTTPSTPTSTTSPTTTTTGPTTTSTTSTGPTTTATGPTTTTSTVASQDVTATTTSPSAGSEVAGESLAATGRNAGFAVRVGLLVLAAGLMLLLISFGYPGPTATPHRRKRGRSD